MSEDGHDRKLSRQLEAQTFLDGLKNEWKLFWQTLGEHDIVGEHEVAGEEDFYAKKVSTLELEQVYQLSKALSQDRKLLNQKLEKLNRDLELHSIKLESSRLLGEEDPRLLQKINDLSDLGEIMIQQLNLIDNNLRIVREQEIHLKESSSNL
jgi:hypothetical protein